jgi:hypothetical protein
MAKVFMRPMRSRESPKSPPLDHSSKTPTFRGSGDINQISRFKDIGHLDLLPDLALDNVLSTELAQDLKRSFARLRHVALLGSIHALALLLPEAELHGIVAVLPDLFLLYDHAWACLDDGDRHNAAIGSEELCHTDFLAYQACHLNKNFDFLVLNFELNSTFNIQNSKFIIAI